MKDMPMTDQEINMLMQDIGSMKTAMQSMDKKLDLALDTQQKLEAKINKHTGMLAAFGSLVLFLSDKIKQVIFS